MRYVLFSKHLRSYLTRATTTELGLSPHVTEAVQFRTKKEAVGFLKDRLHSKSQQLFEVQDAPTGEKHAAKKRSPVRPEVLPSTNT